MRRTVRRRAGQGGKKLTEVFPRTRNLPNEAEAELEPSSALDLMSISAPIRWAAVTR